MFLACSCGILPAANTTLAGRYERIFLESQTAFQRQPTNAEAAWQYARACYDCVDFATNNAQRADLAWLGIAAARASINLRSNLAPAHYYLGINLGCLAEATRTLGGLKLVSEMERSFKKAGELEAGFDFAGPDRCLGLLYRDAPGWPISVGGRAKARQHLERARELAQDYPENQLNLLEAWIKWGEKKQVVAELKKVEDVIAAARKKLTGEAWALSWSDWERRWRGIQSKVADSLHTTTSPKEAR